MIRIRSLKDGFRRCGIAHSAQPVEYPDEQFTADELEQLLTEPMLTVLVLPNPKGESIELTIEQRSDDGDPGEQRQPESGDLAPINADACTDGLNTLQAVLVDKADSETPAETVKPAKKPAK
jgi:hypothetical protein